MTYWQPPDDRHGGGHRDIGKHVAASGNLHVAHGTCPVARGTLHMARGSLLTIATAEDIRTLVSTWQPRVACNSLYMLGTRVWNLLGIHSLHVVRGQSLEPVRDPLPARGKGPVSATC